MNNIFSNNDVSRERVVGLTLIDIFIQFVFLLLGILGYLYAEDFSIEKWDNFKKQGHSIYGAGFSETWQDLPGKTKPIPPKPVDIVAVPIEPPSGASAPGLPACLDVTKPESSAFFYLAKDGIHFEKFSSQYKNFVSNEYPQKQKYLTQIESNRQRVYDPEDLRREFAFMMDGGCQHYTKYSEAKDLVVDAASYAAAELMKNAVRSVGKNKPR